MNKLPPAEAEAQCTLVLQEFREVSAPIPAIALHGYDLGQFTWSVVAPDFWCGDYVGKLAIHQTLALEPMLELPDDRLRAAPALCDSFEIALFCDFHHPGGLQSLPRIQLKLEADGRDSLMAMSAEIQKWSNILTDLRSHTAVTTTVFVNGSACDDQVDPPNLEEAFTWAASEARLAAIEDSGDDLITEGVVLLVDIGTNGSDTAGVAEWLIKILGGMFATIVTGGESVDRPLAA